MSFDKSVGAQAVLCSLVSVSQRYIISEWGTPVAPSSWTDAYYLILKSHLIYTVWQEEELSHSLDLTMTRFFLEAKSFTCKAIKHVTLHSGWPPHMCHGQHWHLAAEGHDKVLWKLYHMLHHLLGSIVQLVHCYSMYVISCHSGPIITSLLSLYD